MLLQFVNKEIKNKTPCKISWISPSGILCRLLIIRLEKVGHLFVCFLGHLGSVRWLWFNGPGRKEDLLLYFHPLSSMTGMKNGKREEMKHLCNQCHHCKPTSSFTMVLLAKKLFIPHFFPFRNGSSEIAFSIAM